MRGGRADRRWSPIGIQKDTKVSVIGCKVRVPAWPLDSRREAQVGRTGWVSGLCNEKKGENRWDYSI